MHSKRCAIVIRRATVAAFATAATLGVAGCGTDTDDSVDRASATVHSVPSGDSVTLIVDGGEKTFDLAYLEAPDPTASQSDSCLASSSKAELRSVLPAKTVVTFEESGSGILLYDENGRLVNAAPVEAGLALIPAQYDNSADVPATIIAALEQARVDRVGLHGISDGCTAPSVLSKAGFATECLDGTNTVLQSASPSARTSRTASSTIASSSGATTAESSVTDLQADLAASDTEWAELARLSTWIHTNRESIVWRALSATQRTTCQDQVHDELGTVLHHRTALAEELGEAQERAAEAARLAEEQRKAAEAEAARVAEEQRLAAEAEASRAAQNEQSQPGTGSGGGSGNSNNGGSNSSPSGGYTGNLPGYNGPRCYAPGGQTWRPC